MCVCVCVCACACACVRACVRACGRVGVFFFAGVRACGRLLLFESLGLHDSRQMLGAGSSSGVELFQVFMSKYTVVAGWGRPAGVS